MARPIYHKQKKVQYPGLEGCISSDWLTGSYKNEVSATLQEMSTIPPKFLPHSIIGVDVKNCVYIYMILFIIKSYLHPYDIPSLQTSQRYSIWLWIMYPLSRVPFWCHGAVFSASPLLMQRMQSFVHGLDVRGASATGGKKANVGSRHLMLIYINITRLYIPSLKLT